MGVSHLAVQTASVPRPMSVDTAALQLTPRNAQLTAFNGRIGNSDVRASGSLDNVLGFALRKQELRGTATVASNHFDLNEWKSNEKTTQVIPVPPHVDFALKATAAEVLYGKILATNVRGGLHVKDQRVTIEGLAMDALRGGVVANGYYETVALDRPSFDVDLALTKVDIPSAFAALTTVQALAPVARWAQGSISGTVKLKGVLGQDMTPVFTALTGQGGFETERLVMQNAPVLGKLADALSLDAIRNPAIGAFNANFDVADGRLHIKPFTVKLAGMDVNVTGSNGIDQSIKYDLGMAVPSSMLGGAAGRTVSNLALQAGKAGFNLTGAGAVQIGAQLTGTVTNPSVRPSFGGVAGSATDMAKQVATTGVATAKLKADSAAGEARRRASAEADRLVKEAEAKATTIREQARALAATTKAQGYAHADSLQAKATNPIAKMAAQAATDRLRREADQRADQIVREADGKADALVARRSSRPRRYTERRPTQRMRPTAHPLREPTKLYCGSLP
jgi:Archaeal/vacuolar-type H+-ATPase subunit H